MRRKLALGSVFALLSINAASAFAQNTLKNIRELERVADIALDSEVLVDHVRAVFKKGGQNESKANAWLARNSAKLSSLPPENLARVLSATQAWELELAVVRAPYAAGVSFDFAKAMRLPKVAYVGAETVISSAAITDTKAPKFGEFGQQLVFTPTTPCRIADSRPSFGGPGPLIGGSIRTLVVASAASYAFQGGISQPCGATGFSGTSVGAVLAAISTFGQSDAGFLTVFETTKPNPAPNAVAQWYQPSLPPATTTFVVLPVAASLTPQTNIYSSATTQYAVDVVGFFARPTATPLECISITSGSSSLQGVGPFFVPHGGCPTGYTKTSGFCYGANILGTDIQLKETGGAGCTYVRLDFNAGIPTVSLGAGVTCCRIPGR